MHLLIGATLLAIGVLLLFLGLPNRNGASPRFLQFEAALVLYPPLVQVFVVGGVAELTAALLGI
jgi:hypothetical protein